MRGTGLSSCNSFFLKLTHATGKVPTQLLRMCNLCPRCEFFNNGSKNKLKRPNFLLSFEFLHSRSQWQLTQQKWMATSNSFLLVFLLSVWQSEASWGVEEVAIFNDSKDVVQLIFVLIFFCLWSSALWWPNNTVRTLVCRWLQLAQLAKGKKSRP